MIISPENTREKSRDRNKREMSFSTETKDWVKEIEEKKRRRRIWKAYPRNQITETIFAARKSIKVFSFH